MARALNRILAHRLIKIAGAAVYCMLGASYNGAAACMALWPITLAGYVLRSLPGTEWAVMWRVIPPTGNEIEDYLDPIGLSLEQFCGEMTGGWLFGFTEALKLQGWRRSAFSAYPGMLGRSSCVSTRPLAQRWVRRWKLARVAICHGRIDIRRRSLDILVDAWRRVIALPAAADFRLILVGDGGQRGRAATYARRRALEWHRGYTVDRSLISRLLHAADAYVMASWQEGFPVPPLEAVVSGLPVVAGDAPPR